MSKKHYPIGPDDRMRDRDGEIRRKRSDTLVGTLRKTYGSDFAKGYRSDAKLGTLLNKEGVDTAVRRESEKVSGPNKSLGQDSQVLADQRPYCYTWTGGDLVP
jgi:hypothetical protein